MHSPAPPTDRPTAAPVARGPARAWRGAAWWSPLLLAGLSLAGCDDGQAPVVTARAPAVATTVPTMPARPSPPDAATFAGPVEVVWATDGAPQPFDRPTALAVDGEGTLYVLVDRGRSVQKLDRSGRRLARWSGLVAAPVQAEPTGGLADLGGLAVDSRGDVYLSDGSHSVLKLDRDGRLLARWGEPGRGEGQFQRPSGLAIDRHDRVYVADRHNHRVQKFDGAGRFLLAWGGPGEGGGEFQQPLSIAVNGRDEVYVADVSGRIQKFDAHGAYLGGWGRRGTAEGEFGRVVSLAVDAAGIVYAADYGNHRVQVFDGDGNFLAQWGGYGRGDGQFEGAGGIAVDDRRAITVASVTGGRVQQFRARVAWPAAPGGTPTPRSVPVSPPPRLTPTDR